MKPARVELVPLSQNEMELCLNLLRAQLHKPTERRDLIGSVQDVLRSGPYYLVEDAVYAGAEKLRRNTKLLPKRPGSTAKVHVSTQPHTWKSWRTDAEDRLWRVQNKWRSIASEPRSNPVSWKNYKSIDEYLLLAPGLEYPLPPFRFSTKRERLTQVLSPTLSVSIRNVDDLFNWLLARAAANKQMSRFAHCVVCGRWELKTIAGRRSGVSVDYAKNNPSILKWSEFYVALPMWPAVCGNSPCKAKFKNVVKERSKFLREHFHGLSGEGIKQIHGTKPRFYDLP